MKELGTKIDKRKVHVTALQQKSPYDLIKRADFPCVLIQNMALTKLLYLNILTNLYFIY